MSTSEVQPYLFFAGNCEEALSFYQQALSIEMEMMMRFSESPEPMPEDMVPAGYENKIMHASFKLGDSIIMASDGCSPADAFKGFALSIALHDQNRAKEIFAALSVDGTVQMPLEKTFWSPLFGSVVDKFGVNWMINCV